MSINAETAIAELSKSSGQARKAFGHLSEGQLNWKPEAERWSIGQCLEHLIKTNNSMMPAFEAISSGAHNHSFWESVSPFSGFLGSFLIKSMKNDEKKFKAPSKRIVPPSSLPADIVSQFAEHNEGVSRMLGAVRSTDIAKTIISSPFMGLMTYSLGDAMEIIVEHEKRHIRQAERLMAMEFFPVR